MDKQFGIALYGLGSVAQSVHLPVLLSMSSKYKIISGYDPSPTLCTTISQQYNFKACKHPEEIINDNVDAVAILSSDEFHVDGVELAASARKHILLEKPGALAYSHYNRMESAIKENKVFLMIGYMRRYADAVSYAKNYIKKNTVQYAAVRDIIPHNNYYIQQGQFEIVPNDVPEALQQAKQTRAKELEIEFFGKEVSSKHRTMWRMLSGLGIHDMSVFTHLLGYPDKILSSAAVEYQNGFIAVHTMKYNDFLMMFEYGVSNVPRLDMRVELYFQEGDYVQLQYDTPYIRKLPTLVHHISTRGDVYTEHTTRPTFRDPYVREWELFYKVLSGEQCNYATLQTARRDLDLIASLLEKLD